MNNESDFAVTWAVQTLKGIHRDVLSKVSLIEELENKDAAGHAAEIAELKGEVKARALALKSLLAEVEKRTPGAKKQKGDRS